MYSEPVPLPSTRSPIFLYPLFTPISPFLVCVLIGTCNLPQQLPRFFAFSFFFLFSFQAKNFQTFFLSSNLMQRLLLNANIFRRNVFCFLPVSSWFNSIAFCAKKSLLVSVGVCWKQRPALMDTILKQIP